MSVNSHRPHILVLPEDDANRQIANGFLLEPAVARGAAQVQVLPVARGWSRVRHKFETELSELLSNPCCHVVLVVDFDRNEARREQLERVIPRTARDRAFVVGVWSEPEEDFGSYEKLGRRLASDCRQEGGEANAWEHELLAHNRGELARMRQALAPIVFG
ncbi:MAG: hypothetical protein AB1758_22760 [Candidatus Eremiobacterota bacterium]